MRVRVAHVSLQHSDTNRQISHDVEKVFERLEKKRVAWITGTESGPNAGNMGEELVKNAREAGYRPWVPSVQSDGRGQHSDCWLAVRKDLVVGDWDAGFIKAFGGSQELYRQRGINPDETPRWGPKGLVYVGFNSVPKLGRVNIGVAHYLNKAQHPNHSTVNRVNRWELNEDLAGVVGDWARRVASGRGLAFYAGDQNMNDSKNRTPQGDTFFGEKFTSLADELKRWQNTGHGPIDVIASYDKDGRVKGRDFDVYGDKEFFLHSDHFYMEGTFQVDPLKR